MPKDLGPPGGEDGEGRANPANVEEVVTQLPITYTRQPSRQCAPETWRRRRAATLRVPALDCRCGTRDPWVHACDRPPLSERMADAGRAAALHLRDIGCTPILRRDTLRALYRRGGDDRALAQHLYTLAGGGT